MIDEAKKQLIEDYQKTFLSDHGKRVYDHLAEVNFYNAPFCTVMACTPQQVAFELGKREAFIQIRDILNTNPDQELQENTDEDL
ncbi:hypothetical protein LCGC14_2825020 [marine sediment metagenome]|uniref:Uncharacterized protein n=1 Tax=marine sediment metagenome TaxID=412755 RepID=A0A0F9B6Z1_9ZZZZ